MSNLTQHLKTSSICSKDYHEFVLEQSKTKYRTPISNFPGFTPSVSINPVLKMKVDDAVKRMIIIDEYPINAVEKIGFQQLMMIALPNYHLPSRNTIMNQLQKDMADYESRMTNRFVNLEFITLVIDAWSNRLLQ